MQIETLIKKNDEYCLSYNSRQICCIKSFLVEMKEMVEVRGLELRPMLDMISYSSNLKERPRS